tara:strand:+ start:90 stop:1763 length:1674 start_codon:yes stop_codon:yes gene_type:complete
MKKLIIGHIPNELNPSELIILGPWSFIDNQSLLFENKSNIEPDPYLSNIELGKDAILAQEIIDHNLNDLVIYLNKINSSDYSDSFWKILIMPWFSTLIQITIERYRRFEKLLMKYKCPIEVDLLTEDKISKFKDTKDFFENGVQSIKFNHWLFSRIIENNINNDIKIKWVDAYSDSPLKNINQNPKSLKYRTKKLLNKFFPASSVYGISFIESPLWELLIYLKKFKEIEKRDKKSYYSQNKYNNHDFVINWKKLFINTLPQEFKRIPNNLYRPKPRFILTGQRNFYQINVENKLSLAMHKEVGSKIICSQHGSRYGTLQSIPYINSIEYDQDWFISWGWTKQSNYKINTIDLPSPYLQNKRKKIINQILFIGQDSPLFSYRLDSIPQPNDYIEIAYEVNNFVSNLDERIKNNLKFRFYPEKRCNIDYDLFFKDIIKSKSKYFFDKDHIFTSKLVVIDHPGTIFHQRMALNLPTIGFWDESKWGFCYQAKPYFDNLRKVGVIQKTGSDASKKINEKYFIFDEWWMRSSRQNAICDWNNKFAKSSKNWRKNWIKTLWKL